MNREYEIIHENYNANVVQKVVSSLHTILNKSIAFSQSMMPPSQLLNYCFEFSINLKIISLLWLKIFKRVNLLTINKYTTDPLNGIKWNTRTFISQKRKTFAFVVTKKIQQELVVLTVDFFAKLH